MDARYYILLYYSNIFYLYLTTLAVVMMLLGNIDTATRTAVITSLDFSIPQDNASGSR